MVQVLPSCFRELLFPPAEQKDQRRGRHDAAAMLQFTAAQLIVPFYWAPF